MLDGASTCSRAMWVFTDMCRGVKQITISYICMHPSICSKWRGFHSFSGPRLLKCRIPVLIQMWLRSFCHPEVSVTFLLFKYRTADNYSSLLSNWLRMGLHKCATYTLTIYSLTSVIRPTLGTGTYPDFYKRFVRIWELCLNSKFRRVHVIIYFTYCSCICKQIIIHIKWT